MSAALPDERPARVRLLVLEDSLPDAELAVRRLARAGISCTWERVASRADFVARLDEHDWDVVLADYHVPGFDGIAALRLFRARCPDTPFILVSGVVDEETAIGAMRAGATDYVLKSGIERLVPVVERALRERAVAIGRQQTERTIAEREREQRRVAEQQAAVLDALPAQVALLDPDGVIVSVNESWRRFALANGFRGERWGVGVDYPALCERTRGPGRTDALQVAAGVRAVLGGQAPHFAFEYDCHSPTVQRWFKLSVAPLLAGTRAGAVVMHIDVTDRRLAEQALRDTAELLQAVFACSSNPVFVKDRHGRYLLANDATLRVVGVIREAIIGHTDRDIFPHAVADALMANDHSVMATRRTLSIEETTPGDPPYTFLSTKAPLLDQRGAVIGVVGVAHDITERKRAEDEARRLNAELELRVQARTADLEAANRDLEAFSYSVSHDLRAPLRAIDGFARVLEEDHAAQLDERGRTTLARVRTGARRMNELIEDLLGLAQLGRQSMSPAPVDVGALAAELLDERRGALPAGLSVDIGAGLLVLGDRHLLRIALSNLLDNALKYSATRAAPCLTVGGERRGAQLAVWVRDNGVGFDPALASRLFRPFQRLHAAAEFEGTGIGLAMVRQIVERHGGTVWAEGAPDAGATFWFTLPAAEADSAMA